MAPIFPFYKQHRHDPSILETMHGAVVITGILSIAACTLIADHTNTMNYSASNEMQDTTSTRRVLNGWRNV